MSIPETSRTSNTHQHFKDWINLNKAYIGEATLENLVIYYAFLGGWMAGHKAALDDQMESLQS